jgi:hypothetical protein
MPHVTDPPSGRCCAMDLRWHLVRLRFHELGKDAQRRVNTLWRMEHFRDVSIEANNVGTGRELGGMFATNSAPKIIVISHFVIGPSGRFFSALLHRLVARLGPVCGR